MNQSASFRLFVGLFLLISFTLVTSCSNNTQVLQGKWVRTDGSKTLEIKEVKDDGSLVASYFNPKPINVGIAGWKNDGGKLEVYVELRDQNYPGSFYKLVYNEEIKSLDGTYFQAIAKQTYEVSFSKK